MKPVAFLLVSIALSLGTEWAPYYVSLWSQGQQAVIGSLSTWRIDCNQADQQAHRCSDTYVVPGHLLWDSTKSRVLGLGIVVGHMSAYCESTTPSSIQINQPVIDSLNNYQTVELTNMSCDGKDLRIDVWVPKEFRRHGYSGSKTVVGTYDHVVRTKKLVEFFTSGLPVILTFLLAGIVVFDRLLNSFSRPAIKTPFEMFRFAWIGFMVISSGLANLLLPIVSSNFLFFRVSNFFSWIAHIGPGLLLVSRSTRPGSLHRRFSTRTLGKLHSKLPFTVLTTLSFMFAVSPIFGQALAPVIGTFSTYFLLVGLLTRNAWLCAFSVSLFIDISKHFEISILPQARLSMYFALLSIADDFLTKVRNSSRVATTLKWLRDEIELKHADTTSIQLLTNFCQYFNIKQLSLLQLQRDGTCKITLCIFSAGNWSVRVIFPECVPAVFAHTLSTREGLFHVESSSIFSSNLKKGETAGGQTEFPYYTVIPLVKGASPIGAIGMTNYPLELTKESERRSEFASAVGLILPLISGQIANDGHVEVEGWDSKCLDLSSKLANLESNHASEIEVLESVTTEISKELGLSCIIMQLNSSSRELKIRSISGYSAEVREKYLTSRFFAVSHNEQGPAALAINRSKAVLISDIKWLSGVLHPSTMDVFELAKTRSCAAVPILLKHSKEATSAEPPLEPWGVLWLESPFLGGCSPNHEIGFTMIASALQSLLGKSKLVESNSQTLHALGGFVPQKVLEKLLKGESARETETGYLLMADLCDSTKISRLVGADKWIEFTTSMSPSVARIAEKYGYSLQSLVWDAYYLTKPTHEGGAEIESAVCLAEELNSLFEAAMKVVEFPAPTSMARARFCLTYGDTTRDIRSSLNNHWTIVGTAMASVSKLEQACKTLRGWFFLGSQSTVELENENWKATGISVSSTGEQIIVLDRDIRLEGISNQLGEKLRQQLESRRNRAA